MKIYRNEKIVAYTQGETFTEDELKQIAHPLNTYVFMGIKCETEVIAKNPKLAIEALGYYGDYARQWGDFRDVIEAVDNGDCQLFQKVVKYYKRDLVKYTKKI